MIGRSILGRSRIAAAGLALRAPVAAAAGLGLLALILVALHFAPPSEVEAQSAPATPSIVTVTRNGNTLTASWDAPAGAAKYHVTYTADNGKTWAAAVGPDDGHSTASIDITGIDTTKTYVVGVRAGNAHGWSGWQNSAPNAPDAASVPPATPGAISITRADGTLTASWDAVDGAAKYHITYSSTNRESWQLAAPNHTQASITINVDNQKTYVVAVRAGNAAGWSSWRNSAASAPHTPPPPPPDAPASITVIRVCDSRFEFTWPAVAGATGYDVNTSKDNRKSWTRSLTDVSKTVWKFNDWKKHKTYYVAVRARNAGGESGWTNSAAAPPPPCRPDTLRAVTGTTHGTAGGSITTSWDAGKRASAYNVNYRPDGGEWQRIQSGVSATTHTGTVTSRGGYTVAVQSTGGNGMSQWRNAGVSWLTASGIVGNAATLTLTGHSGDWYVKQTAPTPAGTCSSAISGGTHDLTGLDGGTTQTVTAYSDAGCGNAIASATFTTLNPTLTVGAFTGSGATLNLADYSRSWYVKKTAPTPAGTCSAAITGATHDLTGLTPGTNYYTYTAYSDSGCATALHSVTFAAPVTVSNLSETSNGTGLSITVDFLEANGFTTGDHGAGYTLDQVVIKHRAPTGNPGVFTAAIHEASGGNPAASATYTLSGNSAPASAGDYVYTCSGNCRLDASTTYFLVVSGTSPSIRY